MSNYALADTKTQNFQSKYPGADMTLTEDKMVLVIHTTEGLTWPGYDGGAMAPTYTGMPPRGPHDSGWRAHFPDEKSARALENHAGGVQTNTQNCVQIELVGTCDPKHKKSWNGKGIQYAGVDYVYWPDATDEQLKWLADFVADQHKRHGLQLVAAKFNPYPSSYGTNQGDRMTFAEWNDFAGICGHQHVPENSHGDPGYIDIAKVIEFAKGTPTPPKPTPPKPAKKVAVWDKPETWVIGATGEDVVKLGKRIVVWSKHFGLPAPYKVGPSSPLSQTDISALSKIQKKWWPSAATTKGGDADGYPGHETFKKLLTTP